MRFDDKIIDRILSETSIVAEFEALGVETIGNGGERKALCCFHPDKTPSLSINEDAGLYHCFSCKAGGNVFTLLKEKKGMVFREAVKYLAAKAGIDVSAYDDYADDETFRKRQKELDDVVRMNVYALEYFRGLLHKTARPMEYLKSRGFSPAALGAFQVGYGGDAKTGLLGHLKDKGFTEEQAVSAGLVGKSDKTGDFYDLFRGRIMFPVLDARGRVAGFSGRTLDDAKGRAKYMNTKETVLFRKDSLLFGYHENVQAIRDIKSAIIVEGYLDVIGLWQAGFRFAVASMGTALSDNHARLIAKTSAENVFVMYDGDEAGRKAAMDALVRLAGQEGLRAVRLPAGKDPDEIALGEGRQAVDALINASLLPPDALFEDRQKSFEYAAKLPSSIDRERFLAVIAEKMKVSAEAVRSDFASYGKPGRPADKPEDETDGETYEGKSEFDTWIGHKVVISKDWKMFQKKEYEEKDKKTGEKKPVEDWTPIETSHVLIPRYRVRIEDETVYTIECRRPRTRPFLISIPEAAFGESTKLQNVFVKNGIAINVGRLRNLLHVYCISNAAEVRPASVGVNYTKDGTFLAGYDYIVKEGKYYPAKENVVEVGPNEVYFITGYNLKDVNRTELLEAYSKPDSQPEGKIQEWLKKADKLFLSKEKSRIAASFLATAMLRGKLIRHFGEVPSLNFYGQTPSTGKTTFLNAFSAITNVKVHRAEITPHQLYTLQEFRTNGLIMIDDMRPVENYVGFLKDASTNSFRPRRGLDGKLNSPQLKNSVFITTNHQISLESEGDADAIESRIINIHFTKEDSVVSYKNYKDFENFTKRNAFDIYLDFYNQVAAVDMDALDRRVEEIEEEIVKLNLKSTRIVKMWAILIACGEAIGVRMRIKDYLEYIGRSEGEKMNKSDFMASALLECVIELEKDNQAPLTFKGEPERQAVRRAMTVKTAEGELEPVVFEKQYWLKLSEATEFFHRSQMLKDFSQQNIMKEVYGLPFIQKVPRGSRVKYRKKERVVQNGTFIVIDFANELFRKSLDIQGDYACQLPAGNIIELQAGDPELDRVANNPGF